MIHDIDKDTFWICSEPDCDKYHCGMAFCEDCRRWFCGRFFASHDCKEFPEYWHNMKNKCDQVCR